MKFDKSLRVRRNPPTTFTHFHPFLVPAAQMLVLRGSLTESKLILKRQTSQYAVKDEAMEERDLLSPSLSAPAQKWTILGTDFLAPSVFLCLIITLRCASYPPHESENCPMALTPRTAVCVSPSTSPRLPSRNYCCVSCVLSLWNSSL